MMNSMDDLVTWLRAQIDDDERLAKAATPGPWRKVIDDRAEVTVWQAHEVGTVPVAELSLSVAGGVGQDEADAEHIAAHSPARVLREVEAKRQIIDLVAGAYAGYSVLPRLALPYADRPGYRDEWRP